MHARSLLAILLVGLCGCGDDDAAGPEGTRVTVTYEGEGREVVLETLAPSVQGVPLSDVVEAAWPELDRSALVADFLAGDGFRPARRTDCQDEIPFPGDQLDRGWIDPATADLAWDESFSFTGCMHVRGVATILLFDEGTAGPKVRVEAGDTGIDVDLMFLPTVEVAGAPRVVLDMVVSASGIAEAPHLWDFDLEDADGTRPGEALGATLGWDQLTKGWIDPVTRDLTWDASLALDEAWTLHDARVIRLVEARDDPARSVLVVHGEDQVEVDLGDLPTVEVEAQPQVVLQAVIAAAPIVTTPETFGYDFEGSDGYRIVEGHDDRTPATWDDLARGWVHPVSRNLSWDASLAGFGAPWHVRDVTVIHVIDPREQPGR